MPESTEFTGTIVRVERDGFGIVRFDRPIGTYANNHGVFSATMSSTLPYREMKAGAHLRGIAEIDKPDLAAIKTLIVEPSSK